MADLTEVEFETWKPFAEVYQEAKKAFGQDHAQRMIMAALSTGLLKARALHWYDGKQSLGGAIDHRFNQEIGPQLWTNVIQDEEFGHPLFDLRLWTTGSIEIADAEEKNGFTSDLTHKLFGIRLHPKGVADLLPGSILAASNPVSAAKDEPEGESATPGKPVAQPLLDKWAALYVETYPETEDTLGKVWASAKGMFQGKSVTRDRAEKAVAKLRPRGRGRKKAGE